MRCKSCDYPLWNLADRTCPECGSAFRPSEHEFVPGSVAFGCPHCSQEYYGTDAHGHLEPRRFACSRCARQIDMDEMIVAPRVGVEAERTDQDRMPWLQRGGRGPIRSWLATMKWAMVEPQRLIRATPATTSILSAWLFALVTVAIFLSAGMLLPQLIHQAVVSFRPVGGGMGAFLFSLGGAAGYAVALVVLAVYLIIWAALAHGMLRITGKAPGGFARTCHSIFYSSSSAVPTALPCVGWLLGLVWWIVSATNMVKESQRAHGGRAALAVLLWPALSVLLCVGVYVAAFFVVNTGGPAGMFLGGAVAGAKTSQTQFVTQCIMMHSLQPGTGAGHAIELFVSASQMTTWLGDFCQSGTRTTPADIPVGSGTLEDFLAMGGRARLGAVKDAIDALPANVVAYRFGDFVFTYPGATLTTGDSRLWVVVMLPDPEVNGPPAPTDEIHIGNAGYGVTTTTVGQLPGLLQQQNQYRATLGLPPLPDLTTITHDDPATGSP